MSSALRAGVPITHRDRLPSSSRYELLVKIASGGMATVYVGRLSSVVGTSRLVAIKRAHAHLLEDPAFSKMLIAEAKLASRIHHPNVVAVQNVEELEGELLLVMDYVEGASLADLAGFEDIPLPAKVAVRILLDGCAGLQAAHELVDDDGKPLGIVHRDVSPHNILCGIDGVARLTDFGIAKSSGGGHTASAGAHTSTGALKGKVAYMAPEYVEAGSLDARSDVFSLGIVAWEALTRKRLFRGASEVESLKLVLACDVPRPSEAAPWLGRALDAVIMKALAREPRDRFQGAAELGDALEIAARRDDLISTANQVGTYVRSATADALARRRTLIRERHPDDTTTANARYDEATREVIAAALVGGDARGDGVGSDAKSAIVSAGRTENTASIVGTSGEGEAVAPREEKTASIASANAIASAQGADSGANASEAPPIKTLPLGMAYPKAALAPNADGVPPARDAVPDGSTIGSGVSAQLVEDARSEVRVGRSRGRIVAYTIAAVSALAIAAVAVPAVRKKAESTRAADPAPDAETAASAPGSAPSSGSPSASVRVATPASPIVSASAPLTPIATPSAAASSAPVPVVLHGATAAPAPRPPKAPGHVAPATPPPRVLPAPTTKTTAHVEPPPAPTVERAPPNPYAH